ncbi:MAG: MerR family transcriptional regulator [Pseudonocardiaceae bacterium]
MSTPTERVDARAPAPLPVWTVAAVARQLGVAPATLRSWSLRYGIGPVGHQAGRHRRYTADDIAELTTIRRLTEEGIALSAAVAIARGQRPADPVSTEIVQRLIEVARQLDADTSAALVEQSLAQCGVATTWNQLCRPAIVALDTDRCIDAELLLSWTIATTLRRLPPRPVMVGVVSGAGEVLLACVPGEQHTLALEALLAALAEHHTSARMLGPSVPTSALLHAVECMQPAVAVVWAQTSRTARATPLRRLADGAAAVVAAGPGWRHVRLPRSVTRADSLESALALVLAAARPPPSVQSRPQ